MSQAALPTRHDEAWRYSDHKALAAARLLPLTAETPSIPARTLHAEEVHRLTLNSPAATTARAALHLTVPAGVTATLVQDISGAGWCDHALTLTLEDGARLVHILTQSMAPTGIATQNVGLEVGAQARYEGFVLQTGAHFSRIAVQARANGAGAHLGLSAVHLGCGSQTLELVSHFDHAQPSATSHQRVRTVMTDRATGSYLGKILVRAGAHDTDAVQSSKALLLARTATANTKPELEIHADAVKCAHGATVGALDPQALFYLTARGIAPPQAKALLIRAFIADLIDSLPAPLPMQQALFAQCEAWLEASLQAAP